MARIPAAKMAFAKPTDWTDQLVQISCLLIGWNVAMEEFTGQAGMCLVDGDAIPPPPGAALVHRQKLSILANRYFGEFEELYPMR
jgi:hypothetical protein